MARGGGRQNEFFGDPFWWMDQKKEWEEIITNQSDPLTRPGNQPPSHGFWGSNTGGGYFK